MRWSPGENFTPLTMEVFDPILTSFVVLCVNYDCGLIYEGSQHVLPHVL